MSSWIRDSINLRFIFLGTLVGLLASIGAAALYFGLIYPQQIANLLGPTPIPPTILLPAGPLPSENAGLSEWVQSPDQPPTLAGSGFILELPDGNLIGVTTAHSLGLPQTLPNDTSISLRSADDSILTALLQDCLVGAPRTDANLTVDYLILPVLSAVPTHLVLKPDPRGSAQAGERVVLFSGVHQPEGKPHTYTGTVLSVEAEAIWVIMDSWFNPGLMSGSPVLSQHTGKVLGMAIAAQITGSRLNIGLHPVVSILEQAQGLGESSR
ncbi:MAG: hypothetical protein AB1345_14480 [Chloroflexota bacterium]